MFGLLKRKVDSRENVTDTISKLRLQAMESDGLIVPFEGCYWHVSNGKGPQFPFILGFHRDFKLSLKDDGNPISFKGVFYRQSCIEENIYQSTTRNVVHGDISRTRLEFYLGKSLDQYPSLPPSWTTAMKTLYPEKQTHNRKDFFTGIFDSETILSVQYNGKDTYVLGNFVLNFLDFLELPFRSTSLEF